MSRDEEQRRVPTLDEAIAVIRDCIAQEECHDLRVSGQRHERPLYRVDFGLDDLVLRAPVPEAAVSDYRDSRTGDLRSIVLAASSELHRRKSAGR